MKKFKLILIGTIAAISLIGMQSCKDKEVDVTGITLNKTNITLEVGSTETLKAVVTPEDATDNDVKWTTSNDKIATVKGGKVTAVAEGTAVITATAGGEEATCVVKITPKEKIRYKLGDYYPDPNSSSTAVGMVFWIDPSAEGYDATDNSGFSGKIVHKEQNNSLAWSTETREILALSRTDGMANLETLKSEVGIHLETDYPAFKWCVDKGAGWYLPAVEELMQLYYGVNGIYPASTWDVNGTSQKDETAWNAFNAKMTAAGGAEVNGGIWSSTEDTHDYARDIVFDKNDVNGDGKYGMEEYLEKTISTHGEITRAIRKF